MALPLLTKQVVEVFWKYIKICPFDLEPIVKREWDDFIVYMEKEWLSKEGNIWNFNQLGRVRTTNPAESYHSALKKFETFF